MKEGDAVIACELLQEAKEFLPGHCDGCTTPSNDHIRTKRKYITHYRPVGKYQAVLPNNAIVSLMMMWKINLAVFLLGPKWKPLLHESTKITDEIYSGRFDLQDLF